MKLYVMCGVVFSGKSTLASKVAEHKRAVLVSQDRYWYERVEEWGLSLDSAEDWERIKEISKAEVRRALMEGSSVVYDDICLRYSDRESLRTLAKEHGAETVLIYLDTPRSIQQERRARNLQTMERYDVPDHIIDWGLTVFEIPQEDERPFVFTPDTDTADWLAKLP